MQHRPFFSGFPNNGFYPSIPSQYITLCRDGGKTPADFPTQLLVMQTHPLDGNGFKSRYNYPHAIYLSGF
jgi:hypothetical protein